MSNSSPPTGSLHDAIVMLIEDQSLFESSTFDGSHEELIANGAMLCQKLKDIEELGQPCIESISQADINIVINCIKEYESLLLPPKALLGCFSCNKPKRTGIEYEKRKLTVHAAVIHSIFIIKSAILGYECEKLNEGAKIYSNYAIRMNTLANTLEGISVKSNDHAKDQLSEALDVVEDFVKDFFASEMKESYSEATKRIRKTREMLNPDNGKSVNKRTMVSAQGNMQEIMNSAASVSAAKSKEKMDALDRHAALLKEASSGISGLFRDIEGPMSAVQLDDLLDHHKEQVDVLEKRIDEKIKTLKKMWKTIRGQSTYRPVATYDELEDFKPQAAAAAGINAAGAGINAGVGVMGAGVGAAAAGVGAAAVGAGNMMGKGLQLAANVPFKAASIAVNVPNKMANAAVKGVSAASTIPNQIFGK